MTDHSASVSATLSINLDQFVGYVYDEDGGELPEYFRNGVVNAVAALVAKDLGRDVRAAVLTAVQEQVGAVVTEALSEPFQPMTTYGTASGSPTTLRDLIGEEAKKFLTVPRDQFSSQRSPLAEFLRSQVDSAFKGELKKAVDQAREQVVQRVKDNAAAVIADTIARSAVR